MRYWLLALVWLTLVSAVGLSTENQLRIRNSTLLANRLTVPAAESVPAPGNDYELFYEFGADHNADSVIVNTGGASVGNGTAKSGGEPDWIAAAGATSAHVQGNADGNDYINTGWMPTWNANQALTVACWAKTAGTGGRIFGASDPGSPSDSWISCDLNSNERCTIRIEDKNGNDYATYTSIDPVPLNQWVYIVWQHVPAENQLRVYIDGVLKQTRTGVTYTTVFHTATNNVAMGALAFNYQNAYYSLSFQGEVDDLTVDDTAWSSNRIYTQWISTAAAHPNS